MEQPSENGKRKERREPTERKDSSDAGPRRKTAPQSVRFDDTPTTAFVDRSFDFSSSGQTDDGTSPAPTSSGSFESFQRRRIRHQMDADIPKKPPTPVPLPRSNSRLGFQRLESSRPPMVSRQSSSRSMSMRHRTDSRSESPHPEFDPRIDEGYRKPTQASLQKKRDIDPRGLTNKPSFSGFTPPNSASSRRSIEHKDDDDFYNRPAMVRVQSAREDSRSRGSSPSRPIPNPPDSMFDFSDGETVTEISQRPNQGLDVIRRFEGSQSILPCPSPSPQESFEVEKEKPTSVESAASRDETSPLSTSEPSAAADAGPNEDEAASETNNDDLYAPPTPPFFSQAPTSSPSPKPTSLVATIVPEETSLSQESTSPIPIDLPHKPSTSADPTAETQAFESTFSASVSTKQSLEEQYKILRSRVPELEATIAALTSHIQALEYDALSSQEKQDHADSSFQKLKETHKELENQQEILLNEIEELKEIQERTQQELREQTAQRKLGESKIREYEAENLRLGETLQYRRHQLQDPEIGDLDISTLKQEIETLTQAIDSNLRKIAEYKSILDRSSELPHELVTLSANVKLHLDRVWTTFAKTKAQNEKLAKELQKREHEIERLQDEVARREQDERDTQISRTDPFRMMYEDSQRRLQRTRAENMRLRGVALSLERAVEYEEQNREIRDRYAELEDRYEVMKAKKGKWKEKAKSWREDAEMLQQQQEELRREHQAEIAKLESEKIEYMKGYYDRVPERGPEWWTTQGLRREIDRLEYRVRDLRTENQAGRKEHEHLIALYNKQEKAYREGKMLHRETKNGYRRVPRYESDQHAQYRKHVVEKMRKEFARQRIEKERQEEEQEDEEEGFGHKITTYREGGIVGFWEGMGNKSTLAPVS